MGEQKHFAVVALETADKTEDGILLSHQMAGYAIESVKMQSARLSELQATNQKLVEALKEIVSARKMVEESFDIENKRQRGVVFSNGKVRLEAAIESASALIGEVEDE